MDSINTRAIDSLCDANTPTGPCVAFVARSSRCHNGASLHGQKMWLRGSMSYVENAFRSKYGYVRDRPRAYCAFVHESNCPLAQTDDGIQYLSAIMQRARAAKTQAIIVISGWDGLTTDEQTFLDLFKDFKEIKVTLRIYATFGGDEPRQFWEADAHRVSADFEGKITLEDDSETDYSALFAERFRFFHGKRAAQGKAIQVLMSMTGRSHKDLIMNADWMLRVWLP